MQRLSIYLVFTCLLAGNAVAQEHKISVQHFEPPTYPPIARQAHIEGEVKLQLAIAANGEVVVAKVMSGHGLLQRAALENIKQWRFHCDDCSYDEAFRHTFIYVFSIGNLPCDSGYSSFTYEFPGRVALKRSPPCIDTQSTDRRKRLPTRVSILR